MAKKKQTSKQETPQSAGLHAREQVGISSAAPTKVIIDTNVNETGENIINAHNESGSDAHVSGDSGVNDSGDFHAPRPINSEKTAAAPEAEYSAAAAPEAEYSAAAAPEAEHSVPDSDMTGTPDPCRNAPADANDCAPDGAQKDDAHRTTGELFQTDAHYTDDQMMGRLRASVLTTTELYREAQLFAAQNFNVASMVTSHEPCLVQNTLEIARILGLWVAESVGVLCDADARSRDIAGRYILFCLKSGLAPVADTVMAVIGQFHSAAGDEKEYISSFLEKLRILLVSLTAQDREEPSEPQRALTRLCGCFDVQTVERMLCDPDASVRIAVVRSLGSRGEVSTNTLLVALILFKDRNEKVNEAVVKLCAKLKSYPEIVLPQVLPLMPSAGRELRDAISDLLRTYAESAVEPVMSALEDTRETMSDAVVQAISLSPQRYTDALLVALQSARTREFVRTRVAQILRNHRDPSRQEEISIALGLYEKTSCDEYPQWEPPKTQVQYAPSATENADFYTRFLTDDELAAFSKTCDESAVLRLLSDASVFAQINAMKVARIRGEASAVALENIAIWLRSENTPVARTAADTWFALNPDKAAAVTAILDALQRIGVQDIEKHYLEIIRNDPAIIGVLFEIYYERPRLASPVVRYLLSHDPCDKTVGCLCAGIQREHTVACIAETLDLLFRYDIRYDNRKLRPLIISLLKDPVSYGQFGLVARLRAIGLLQKYLKADADPRGDRETISALQSIYRTGKNTEIRKRIKNLFKSVDEEIFDFDDEEDDFEDLNDTDEE